MNSRRVIFNICFLVYLSVCISCNAVYLKKYPPTLATRKYLEMPKFLEVKRFKSEFPVEELKTFQHYHNNQGYATPPINYFFSIDENGNVVNGRFENANNEQLTFLKKFVDHSFNSYKWSPAYYANTNEKIKTAVKMSIYEKGKQGKFEISIRLVYLPEKEKLEDTVFEKNLIYKTEIK